MSATALEQSVCSSVTLWWQLEDWANDCRLRQLVQLIKCRPYCKCGEEWKKCSKHTKSVARLNVAHKKMLIGPRAGAALPVKRRKHVILLLSLCLSIYLSVFAGLKSPRFSVWGCCREHNAWQSAEPCSSRSPQKLHTRLFNELPIPC